MHGFHLPIYANKILNCTGCTEVGNNKDTTFLITCMKAITNGLYIEKKLFYLCSFRRNNNNYHPRYYFHTYYPTHFIGIWCYQYPKMVAIYGAQASWRCFGISLTPLIMVGYNIYMENLIYGNPNLWLQRIQWIAIY